MFPCRREIPFEAPADKVSESVEAIGKVKLRQSLRKRMHSCSNVYLFRIFRQQSCFCVERMEFRIAEAKKRKTDLKERLAASLSSLGVKLLCVKRFRASLNRSRASSGNSAFSFLFFAFLTNFCIASLSLAPASDAWIAVSIAVAQVDKAWGNHGGQSKLVSNDCIELASAALPANASGWWRKNRIVGSSPQPLFSPPVLPIFCSLWRFSTVPHLSIGNHAAFIGNP